MRFRLGWLDFALFALLTWACWDFAADYRQSAGRHAIFNSGTTASETTASPGLPQLATVQATDYAAINGSLFFIPERSGATESSSRSVVRMQPGPLPVLFGIADLGNGPSALLSPRRGERARWISPGEMAGEYRLQEISADRLVFTRDGRRFAASPAELRQGSDRRPEPRRASVVAGRQQAAGASRGGGPSSRLSTARSGYRIGTEFRPGRFAADAADGAADGTVFQGYVRRVRQTPFGAQHWWERKEP